MPRFALRLDGSSMALLLLLHALAGIGSGLHAQGPTTAAIAGRIADERGRRLAGVEVVVTNRATGVSMRSVSRADGRYLVAGLDVGGPYAVTVRRIGSRVNTRSGFFLTLGEQLQVDVDLERQPVTLPGMETQVQPDRIFSRAHKGAEAFLSDSVIHRMPVINRDLYDLVRLVPQTATWFPLTASGANARVNSIRIDGIGDQVVSSNLAAGALYGGRVIPLDAVREYQVLLSPFDVRHGGFAGASINVVTRSGTNDVRGSVFAYGTNERLGANAPFIRSARYEKAQFGFSLGGPIVRDRLHVFLASELQRRVIPADGPFVSENRSSEQLSPSPTDIGRFQQLLVARGLEGGSSGPVVNPNPSASVFVRLDAPIPAWNSRVTVRGTYGYGDSAIFARPTMLAPTNCPTDECFPLSSLRHARWVEKRSAAVHFVTSFAHLPSFGDGGYNEMLLGYTGIVSGFRPTVRQPLVLVTVPGVSGAPAFLQSGTHEIATGQRNASWTTEVTDNLTIVAGAHRLVLGLSAQHFALHAFQLRGAYGVWEFASLDSLEVGVASRYRVTRDTGSVTAASGGQYAVYLGDDWNVSQRLSITLGLRADIPFLSARPPFVRAVDSTFHLRTDAVPSGQARWSPRFGFNYDLTTEGGAPMQLRGGVGVFGGRPPLFWLFGGFSAYGLASRTLECGSLPSDAGAPPGFVVDYRNPPIACAGGQTFGAGSSGEIDVLGPNLRFPQVVRASVAVDRQLPFGLVVTLEGLYTRSTHSIHFSNVNLGEPLGADRHGRLLYGTLSPTGVSTPRRVASELGDVIVLTSRSKDYAYDATMELRKVGRLADVQAAVSYGRTRDVQSPRPVSAILADNWRFSHPVSGRHDDIVLGTSDYDQPYRVRVSGTIHSPWRKLATDITVSYVGGSGFPYTYVSGGTQGRGDLNADGAVGNDPLYIPRTSFDTAEVRFAGSPAEVRLQQVAFERFIDGAACLRRQRGRIMTRNSCRSPWMHRTSLAVRQTVPTTRTQSVAFEVQVFNPLNLLNPRWGRLWLPGGAAPTSTSQIVLLSQVSRGTQPGGQPIYRFDSVREPYAFENVDSYYQIQLAARYSF